MRVIIAPVGTISKGDQRPPREQRWPERVTFATLDVRSDDGAQEWTVLRTEWLGIHMPGQFQRRTAQEEGVPVDRGYV